MREVLIERAVPTPAGEARVEVVVGDITREEVDAIVNAANSMLAHGGGVAGAIRRRGGPEIVEDSRAAAPVPVGEAAVTRAGRLPARMVVHAVGPRWGEGDEDDKLARAVRSALRLAAEHGAASVAVPAISTGIYGFPVKRAAPILVETALDVLARHQGPLRTVRFIDIDAFTAGHLARALAEAIPEAP